MKKLVLVVLAVMIPAVSFAAPTPEATKEVLEHFWNGSTPILVESKFCADIGKDGANKNECVSEVDPAAVAKGQKVYLWLNFMVPQDTAPSISILFSRKGRPERSADVNLKGSLRYRTWTTLPTEKAGDYAIQVDQDINDNFTTLKSLTYKVGE